MRLQVTSITVLGALVALSTAAQAQRSASPEDALRGRVTSGTRFVTLPVQESLDSAARSLLLRRVDRVDWNENTFEEVLDWLRDLAEDRVNVIPRWSALSLEGVDQEKPVTLQLRNVSVSEVLDEVLNQVAEEGKLTYRAIGHNLRISTRQDFERKMEVRVYNVSDLLFRAPDFGEDAPTIDLNQAGRGGGGGGGGGGQSVFSGSGGGGQQELAEEEAELRERLDQLRTIIRKTIAPESWAPEGSNTVGTGIGQVENFNDRAIVVYNTIEVHEQIAGFFTFGR